MYFFRTFDPDQGDPDLKTNVFCQVGAVLAKLCTPSWIYTLEPTRIHPTRTHALMGSIVTLVFHIGQILSDRGWGPHLLRVSALHYLARDRFSEGFWTVASARVLRQPTSCGSEYFYNQCPQVWNLIGTERSLIEVSVGLRRKQAKSNSMDGFRDTEVFSIDLDFGL